MFTIDTTTTPLGAVRDGAPLAVADPTFLHKFGERRLFDFASVPSVHNLPMAGGQWEAFAGSADVLDDGNHVVRSGVRLIDAPTETHTTEECITSDSGVMGFYLNTPIVFWDDLQILVLLVGPTPRARLLNKGDAFAYFTESGLGDGGYTLYVRYAGDRVIGVEAVYIHDEAEAALWIKFNLSDDEDPA